LDQIGDFSDREMVLLHAEGSADGLYLFHGKIPCQRTGRFGYTVRITPSKEMLENRFAMGLVTWA
jgi:starch phosphorylase